MKTAVPPEMPPLRGISNGRQLAISNQSYHMEV